MKIAIHHRESSFSECWIKYCIEKGIDYIIVNAYDNNIIAQTNDCDAFMWHHYQANFKDVLFAKQLLYSLQVKGLKVFPDFKTTWHFDDKVGQKYLLEAIGVPLVPSYVFYNKEEAYTWARIVSYPKVFKLRGGAGSTNVRLVKSKSQAFSLIRRAFSKGFSQFNSLGNLKERYRKYKNGKEPFLSVINGIGRLLIKTEYAKMHGPENGYIYFQDFIPNNNYDVRVFVVGGNRAVGLKRMVRKGDFRASGSGDLVHVKIDDQTLHMAFRIANNLKLQSVAFDFVYSVEGKPLLIEMSYGSPTKLYDGCLGYWDKDLKWHEGKFNPITWIVEDLINSL